MTSRHNGRAAHLRVAELFESIQGETSRAGLPCSFVRLAGCNLNCSYCDTAYAREGGEEIPLEDIVAQIEKMGHFHVCVTGGEPLLQKETRSLVSKLIKLGHEVMVETNGSLPINILPRRARRIVDVKSPGSGEGGSFLHENLEWLTPNDELKFVITDLRDFDWAKRFIRRHHLNGRCELLMSPAYGILNPAELAALIIKSGLNIRLNIQLHKMLNCE